MYKVTTLLKRRPGMSVEDFQRHWREEHARIARAAPGLQRYVQSHTLPQGYSKGERAYDGVSEMWFASREAYQAAKADASYAAAVARDETRFVGLSKKVVMPVETNVIKAGAVPPNAVKNIEFVNRRPGMDLTAFRAYWKNVHGPLASQIELLRRYEQDHLRLEAYEQGATQAFDGLAVTWFDSTAHMKQGAQTEIYARTRADEANFLPDGHLPFIVSREYLIVGQP